MPYARDMDTQLASKFIGMYVNEFTRDYGETGRAAIREFLGRAQSGGLVHRKRQIEFGPEVLLPSRLFSPPPGRWRMFMAKRYESDSNDNTDKKLDHGLMTAETTKK